MKYLCLVYGEENALQRMDDKHCLDFDESIRKSGNCVASEALESVTTATTVRVRNGKVTIVDGPFAETKEALAGFYLIEAKVLLLAGLPIDEPVVGYGPFVMNTREEIAQAIEDFNSGRFGKMPAGSVSA